VEALEKGLGRLEGVLTAKARGVRGPDKFFYEMTVKDAAALTPAAIFKLQKGTPLEDYPLVELALGGLAGELEKGPDGLRFTARGSKQRFAVKPSPGLEKRVGEGRGKVVLGGKVTQAEKGDPVLEVTEVADPK
jgi:hypothetical protein